MRSSTRRVLQAAPANGDFEAERKRQQEINAGLMKADGNENPFLLWRELGALMTENCTVIRYSKKCQEADAKLVDLLNRFQNINLSDRSSGPTPPSPSRASSRTCCSCPE